MPSVRKHLEPIEVVEDLDSVEACSATNAASAFYLELTPHLAFIVGLPLYQVIWLASALHLGAEQALALGMYPFIVGDAIKLMLAACLLPAARRLVESSR